MVRPNSPYSSVPEDSKLYDVVGIGFGPANLALSVAIEEDAEGLLGRPLEVQFLERRPRFDWHPGMLIDGTRIQLSFLKDLVTLRNPQSGFTFLKYLHEKGRLEQFVNLRNSHPTRLEYNDYYHWVVGRLSNPVRYDTEVVALEPVLQGDRVESLRVRHRDVETGRERECLTRQVIVATGGKGYVPHGIDIRASRRIFHSEELLHRLERDFSDRDRELRFVVVGSGQTAAEIFRHLYRTYPNATVTATLRRYAYTPVDDSHFVNEIFFSKTVDFLFDLSPERRDQLLNAHRGTNYSAVDLELIEEIYDLMYRQTVSGEIRARILTLHALEDWVETDDEIELRYENRADGREEMIRADVAILATGYNRPGRHPLLESLAPYLETHENGDYLVERDYRVASRPEMEASVYLQGFSEPTHGLSDTLLSNLAIRSGEILESLVEDLARKPVSRLETVPA